MAYITYNGKYVTIGGKYAILGGGGTPGPVSPVIYDTPGDYVFTVPAGITSIIVECWGGGGGSESIGTNSGSRMTAGAAGGAYARKTISVSPGEEYPLTVGAGGNYVATGTGQGGDTFFNTNVVLAKGGNKSGSVAYISGGVGTATGSIGDIVYAGGSGGPGYGGVNSTKFSGGGGSGAGSTGKGNNGGNYLSGLGGAAKEAFGGKGGDGHYDIKGGDGAPFGGGGAGGVGGDIDVPGGNGGNGGIIISW